MTLRPRTLPLLLALICGLLASPPLLVSAGNRNALAGTRTAVEIRSTAHPPAKMLWASLAPLPEDNSSSPPGPLASDSTESTATGVDEALQLLQSRYYGTVPSRNTLKYAAVRGMVDSLGDRYTRFLDPDQFRRMQEENSGQYGGIGVVLSLNARNQAEVVQVDRDGPARDAGIKVGDVFTEVAGHPIRPGLRAAERAQDLLHGDPRTHVSILFQRKAVKQPFRLNLVRRLTYTPTVLAKTLAHGVGYIKLETFGDRSDEEVGMALRRLKSKGMRSLVFDMRGNPGGFFNAAVDIASRFIDKGPVVFTRDRDNNRVPVPNIPSKRLSPKIPVVVLVDRWSASASEIVAAAIQETGAGIVIGQQTYGKALVQTINPNPDGSAVLITTHHYYTPLGTDISHKGIKPDIAVDATAPRAPAADLPLQRALAYLSDPNQRISIRR